MKSIGRSEPTYPGRVQSDTIAVLALVANTEQHFDIPAGATVATLACTNVFYVLTNDETATVPAATDTSFPDPNTIPELSPNVLSVVAGNLFSAIAPANCILTISFYQDHD